MKKIILVLFCFCMALLSAITAQAQDVIHRKNGKTLEVKILEIGADEVKYKLFTQPDGVTYVMDATLIKKIVLTNGSVHKFEEGGSINSAELYEGQNRSAYKISFLAWTVGYTTFSYERNLKPGRSVEARLGIVGLGNNIAQQKQRGVVGTFGYKFYNTPDYYTSRQRYAHLLKGGYIRPELSIGSYGIDAPKYTYNGTTYTQTSSRAQKTYFCFMLCAGKQWILDNKFAIDVFSGIGLGGVSSSNTNNSGSIDAFSSGTSGYSNYISPNNLAFNFGLNIGLLGK